VISLVQDFVYKLISINIRTYAGNLKFAKRYFGKNKIRPLLFIDKSNDEKDDRLQNDPYHWLILFLLFTCIL